MGNISVFYNNRIVDVFFGNERVANDSVKFGDFCLTPVRYLFNGNKVTISLTLNSSLGVTVDHEKEYSDNGFLQPKRNFLRMIASIVFLTPGLLLGSISKGLGYLSKEIRTNHALAIRHYTPIDRTFGNDNNRLDLKGIIQKLDDEQINNHLNQPTKTLIVYAQPSAQISYDPGILDLDPQKIILDGAKIVNVTTPITFNLLDDTLGKSNDWDNGHITGHTIALNAFPLPVNTRIIQWKVKSINDAIQDILPLKSIFSTERLRRVYVV